MDYATKSKPSHREKSRKKEVVTAVPKASSTRAESTFETTSSRPIPEHYPSSAASASDSQTDPPTSSSPAHAATNDIMQSHTRGDWTPGMIWDRARNLCAVPFVNWVRNSAESYGGTVTFRLSQVTGTFGREILKHGDTAGGVCDSLSAHWIRSRVRGQDLSDQLYPDGRKGQLSSSEVHSIKQLAIDGYAADHQDDVTEQWLENETGGHLYKGSYKPYRERIDAAGPRGMAENILHIPARNHDDAYKMIGLFGRFSAHSVAAHVHRHAGVAFFDPNFGEFHFPDKEDFRRWFADAYWTRSGYRWPVTGLSRKYSVLNFVHLPSEHLPKQATAGTGEEPQVP